MICAFDRKARSKNGWKCVTSLGLAHTHPSVASYHSAGILCCEELKSGQGFLCAHRASLALEGNTRLLLGMQIVPKWLCSQERVRVCDCPELQRWDLLVEQQSHQQSFLLGRGAEAGASRWAAQEAPCCTGWWLYCTCPRSTLPCLSPSFHFYKNIKLVQIHNEQMNRVAHPLYSCKVTLLVVSVSYSTSGHHQHSTCLQQVALIKTWQKKERLSGK